MENFITGTEISTLSVRIKNLREEEGRTENPVVKKVIETRINHIKESVSNHASTDFNETVISNFLTL